MLYRKEIKQTCQERLRTLHAVFLCAKHLALLLKRFEILNRTMLKVF